MKACVLHSIGDIRIQDVPTPKPKKGEVLMKIMASGICGSDIPRVFVKGTYHFPTIPGHEFAGQVIEAGEGVDKALIGKKAAVFPLVPCMRCEACQIGEYAQCSSYNYFGSRCNGGFAQYISVPVWNLVVIPDSLSYEEAAMAEPLAVAIHALRRAGIVMGDQIAIFGSGPIGLMLGQWSLAWGADKVMLIDIESDKIAFAKRAGFKYVWNSNDGDPADWIKDITNGRGADITVEGAGASDTLEQCLKSTRPFGKVVAMGNPAGDIKLSQKAYWELLRKQLQIFGTWNSSFSPFPKNDWALAIEGMESKKIDVKQYITHRFSLNQGPEALAMMKEKSEFYNKVMLVME
jgi:L-iditol 2-dehydrogenase